MPYAAIAIGLLVLAGIAFGAWRLWAGVPEFDRHRAMWLVIGFALAVIAGLTAAMYTQAYYRVPVAVLVGLIAVWLVVLALALAITRTLGRNGRTFLLLATVFVAAAVATLLVGMFSPLGTPTGLIEVRAAQIAEANGFTALLSDEPMITEWMPVDTAPGGDGLRVEYQGFVLQERLAEEPLGEAELRALVAPGQKPLGFVEVSRDASVTVVDVNGRPAAGATFYWAPPEAAVKGLTIENRASVLVLEIDGVDVRLESTSGTVYTGANEQYEYRQALSLDELAAVAASLTPVE